MMADDQSDTTNDSAADDGDAADEGPDALRTARAALRAMLGRTDSSAGDDDAD